MAYIGRQGVIGNFVKLDTISVVNGQAAYTMQNNSVNFTDYATVNQFLVSLNGVIQAPTSSFTVSGSTLTFASNLSTGDVIDFIIVFGNSLSAGTPTDGTVTTAKLGGALVTPSTLDVNGNELILDADADTSIVASTDDQIDFKTGGSDRLTIRNDGVGIGVTSASAPLEVRTNLSSDTQSTPETVLTLATKYSSTSSNGVAGAGSRLEFEIPDDETNPITGAAIAGLKENGDDSNAEAALAFYTSQNDTTLDEQMRITNSGHITAPNLNTTGSTSNRYPLYWVHSGTTGSIEPYTGSIRAMKTNIDDMGSVDWIHSLTPRSFKFRDYETDEDGNKVYLETTNDLPDTEYGLIAEEVNEVNGSDYILDKQIDKDGNENLKGVLYHNLVPVLLKAVQEQKTKIDELEARITTLENK
nr:hypothetical protein [uncultured Mediterranean phage uvMED]